MQRFLVLLASVLVLAACSSDPVAVPPRDLQPFTQTLPLKVEWRAEVEASGFYQFQPAVSDGLVWVASKDKQINAFQLSDGKFERFWSVPAEMSGGVGASRELVVAGGLKGELWAYKPDGTPAWNAQLSSEVIAPPVIVDNIVVARSGDGRIHAFDVRDGNLKWSFDRTLPALLLRNYAPVVVLNGVVYAGFAGGKLFAIRLSDGVLLWDAQVAQPRGATDLERVSDVVSQPVVGSGEVCAVAYQGRVACFMQANGNLIWAREASSALDLAMDGQRLFLSGDDGVQIAFDVQTGRQVWKQDALEGRKTGSIGMLGRFVVVGDYQGYLHYLDPDNGQLVGRMATDRRPQRVKPVQINEKLLVQTSYGNLYLLGVK